MTTKRDLERRVNDLWGEDTHGCGLVITVPENAIRPEDRPEEPPDGDYDLSDYQIDGEMAIPHHKPADWTGIMIVTKPGIAGVWNSMPPEILDKERTLRQENDDPLPPILET